MEQTKLNVNLGSRAYPIHFGRGLLEHLADYVNLDRKVLVLTDDGVPKEYLDIVLAQCPNGSAEVVPMGEGAKSFPVFERVCARMLELNFGRRDLLIALGGGVVGDLGGFAAAGYMRGIDFIQIPTTTLSQIDSSVGGKTAINLNGVKNIIGAFHQPRAVLIDFDTLKTLPPRHWANGLAEAVKMGLILDEDLFALFEAGDVQAHLEEIIYRSIAAKARVVEQDETEQGLRKALNFGHTIGHGIESAAHLHGLYHGECVGLGMLYFITDPALKARTVKVLASLNLPTEVSLDPDAVFAAMSHDKKSGAGGITVVKVDRPGHCYFENMTLDALRALL